MEWGPVDGQYTADVLPWSIGGVRPDAVVTLNGEATPTRRCGAWGHWTNMHCWDFGYTDEGVYRYPLAQGANTLAYRAEFVDGTSMEFAIDVVYDPTLTSSEGFLVDVKPGDPAQAVVWVVDMQVGDADGLDITGEQLQPEWSFMISQRVTRIIE